MLIDTHCHTDMVVQRFLCNSEEKEVLATIIKNATLKDVKKIVNIGTNLTDCLLHLELAAQHDEFFAALGIHPCDLTDSWKNDLKKIRELIRSQGNKVVGIGEIGLDFYHPGFDKNKQEALFRSQIELALELNLPVIIHSRSSSEETLKIIEEYSQNGLKGIIHCFGESEKLAREYIRLGWYLGIGAIISYPKNEELRTTLKNIGLGNIVLETDAPFLPPQPLRGKPNAPEHIRFVADYLAELLDLPYEKVAQITTENTYTVLPKLSDAL